MPPCSGLTDLYYSHQAADQALAVALCRTCPAAAACLARALEADERHGVWGGLTPLDRQALVAEARAAT